ncbi:DUF4142 domain-containing protein [Hymenobacter busanensis]|uniref:DUF4142 domain-containing protein n=1 Tax=Hymenobacter busanensis TaxID=2607656 RepID=A0A7L5A3N7_9BACT|nr:DUF4142 domain-containing protein [Hymenobacter busanensis]KAA9331377.1 DUF4142 domain-containing protein [Hymenobacter busanensis]QHJ08530.1 DUF4142 domain-containing protein [Hymenobacter busanensis]
MFFRFSLSARVLLLPWLLAALAGCGSGDRDPVADAKFENEKRIGDADITKRQERDAEFMVNAATNSLLAVELGKLAQQKTARPEVRTFAQNLLRDHAALNTALAGVATQKGLAVPKSLGDEQQDTYQELAGLTGADFDRRFLQVSAEHYDESADDFEDMSDDAYDGDIRALAAKYAPALSQYRDQAKQLEDALPQ